MQLEAERREAERKARAKKAAAAVGVLGGGGKGATRADWRGELEDVAAGEADGAQRSEDDDEVRLCWGGPQRRLGGRRRRVPSIAPTPHAHPGR